MTTTPKFQHDCDGCKFIGRHEYDGQECDFYICGGEGDTWRTIIARYGNEGPNYTSGGLFICVGLTPLDKFALAAGIEITTDEQERLIKLLLRQDRDRWKPYDYKNIPYEPGFMGNKDWYGVT